ncbi:MAG TPA: hypothetical protein VGJ60_04295 [Chloroflexota bacterium]
MLLGESLEPVELPGVLEGDEDEDEEEVDDGEEVDVELPIEPEPLEPKLLVLDGVLLKLLVLL